MNRMHVFQGMLAALLVISGGCISYKMPDYGKMGWRNPLDLAENALASDPKNTNYVLGRMEYARAAIRLGSYTRARPPLKEIRDQFDTKQDNVAAALSSERFKYYKGETYERAMACSYLGYVEYLLGNHNNARICFLNAISEDKKAVIKKTTPKEVGEDFGLANYWLGKAYIKLNRMDMSRIALRRAAGKTLRKGADAELVKDKKEASNYQTVRAEGERWAYQTFHDPKKPKLYMENIVDLASVQQTMDNAPAKLPSALGEDPVLLTCDDREEFFTPEYQKKTNFVLTIELGQCPHKRLAGMNQEYTVIARSMVRPAHIQVYVDGHRAGRAHQVLDLWEQADTQDRIIEKDAAQIAKSVLKEFLSHLPYVGSLVGYWDVSGDIRHWTSLPGRVFIYAAKLAPGPHTIRLEMYDVNGRFLPRWCNTYRGISAPKSGEACVLLNPRYDGDNELTAGERRTAASAGATPHMRDMTFMMYR